MEKFTFMPASSPKLAMLFCFCRCLLLFCYTLVLSPLFLGVGFGLSLASFWGYFTLASCAFVCLKGSLEPSRTKSCKIFNYPLIELLKIQWMSKHGSFSSCCLVGVCVILEKVVQVNKRFLHVTTIPNYK